MNTRGNDVVTTCVTPVSVWRCFFLKHNQTIKMKKIIKMIIFILMFQVSKMINQKKGDKAKEFKVLTYSTKYLIYVYEQSLPQIKTLKQIWFSKSV